MGHEIVVYIFVFVFALIVFISADTVPQILGA
jgi:hypothetical protein